MKEALYLRNKTAIINFSVAYYKTPEELLSSKGFALFLKRFLMWLAVNDIEMYHWAVREQTLEEYIPHLVTTLKLLMVMDLSDIPEINQLDVLRLLSLVERGYDYWRKLERFTTVSSSSSSSIQFQSFMDADLNFNALIISIYRRLEEKLQGRKNRIYRQLSAGSNGSLVLRTYHTKLPNEYNQLKNIQFINTVMLRTPLMLYPSSNKRTGMFTEVKENPIRYFTGNQAEWYCYPVRVGNLLIFVYFHEDYLAEAVAMSNLFELANSEDCVNKPDAIVIFGNQDEKKETVFFHDKPNDMWIGSLSYCDAIEYFGYLKKIVLTLHNLTMMERGWLPIHGSMVRIFFKDHTVKNVVFIGDSGAGKSESIEALKTIAEDDILKTDVVFDDMGSFHQEDNYVYAQGTEIGAFIRLDDLDRATPYKDMERSIFMNPTSTLNARVILPSSPYELITSNQKIDYVLYANNYEEKVGIHRFENLEKAKEVFIQGRRMALGTTGEKGISDTYFANPFGPMQKSEQCDKIWDKIFVALDQQGTYIGEIYTRLGLENGKEKITESVKELVLHLAGKHE